MGSAAWKVERLESFEMPGRRVEPDEPLLGVVATLARVRAGRVGSS